MTIPSRCAVRPRLVLVLAAALLGGPLAALASAQDAPPPGAQRAKPTPKPTRKPSGGGGGQTGGGPAAVQPTLLISSDMNCTVTIDGEKTYKVKANEPEKINVTAGEHLLKAVSEDGRRSLEQVVKGQGGGNTVVPLKLMSAGVSTLPADFDRQAAKVFTAITDLKPMGSFIGGLWKRSFFFHDRGITEAFHTAGQVLVRETEEFKKFTPNDPKRQSVFDELNRLSPQGQKYVELVTAAITKAQESNSTMGEPTNSFGQAQALLATLSPPPAIVAILKESAAFRDGLPPDARTRAGLPNDPKDVRLGVEYAQSFPQMMAVIDSKSAAEAMGFKPGDRILSAGGRDVASIWEFKQVLREAAGRKVPVVVEREGKKSSRDVKGP